MLRGEKERSQAYRKDLCNETRCDTATFAPSGQDTRRSTRGQKLLVRNINGPCHALSRSRYINHSNFDFKFLGFYHVIHVRYSCWFLDAQVFSSCSWQWWRLRRRPRPGLHWRTCLHEGKHSVLSRRCSHTTHPTTDPSYITTGIYFHCSGSQPSNPSWWRGGDGGDSEST